MRIVGYEYRIDGGSAVDVGERLFKFLSGLTPGETYTVQVRSYDAVGTRSDWSAGVDLEMPLPAPPEEPEDFAANAVSGTNISVTWDDPGDPSIDGYELEIDGVVTDVGNVTNHNAGGFTEGTEHDFRIRSYSGIPQYSAWVGPISETTLTPVDIMLTTDDESTALTTDDEATALIVTVYQ